ncbi:hypothetical protein MHUMG1_00476 [Metarhizium humberi]|uniref:Nucleic acid-binding, OB-fold protein n=1 Tax=Metarhizium humberi TaxID=2596975 RepID=A0A9P8MJH0_9HYPO|nr:hypothetical protein MHUMG1_00476 [Metarhizium humberi]
MPPPKLLLLTGPPPSAALTESSCSIHNFDKPFQDLLGLPAASSHSLPPQTQYTAWRSLPLARQPLHTGFTQAHHLQRDTPSSPSFFTTADTTTTHGFATAPDHDGTQDVLAQFCEQSLAAHNSSAAPDLDSFDTTESASFMTTSLLSEDGQPAPPVPSHLSDLEDVPSAKQVTSLQPQTITLNLIVGVLSVAQPRTVTTKWGTALSLIEVLVGDETAAGFAVTFWVPVDKVAETDAIQLRRQDVVLMENVALHVFRGKVYGQSLRRGLTRLHLLWRAEGGGSYSTRSLTRAGGDNPQVGKVRVVRDWVLRFVGLDRTGRKRRRGVVDWDKPPDHTQ